jgi:UDP-N-acetylglucosamine 2-epimerase (non-hydrolysing)/GDP/UDP-N,N'-diacetylbacillosamine 2-epimerase (hydrolysing)
MRTIAVVTGARADYGLLRPVMNRILAEDGLQLNLLVTGMHLSEKFGMTANEIESDGFDIAARVPIPMTGGAAGDISRAIGEGTLGFGEVFQQNKPDILLVLGDRFEILAAVVAALPFRIPIAHLHGGELTFGALDESMRHAITKMSHLHFVATDEYARRVIQMGEEPWRVTVSGAPGLDNLNQIERLSKPDWESRFGATLHDDLLLVTFHPVTLEVDQTDFHIEELLAALESSGFPTLFTMANADPGGQVINTAIESFVQQNENAQLVDNLGTQGYFTAMQHARAMVGNSSSGIIEAPSFGLPVVNIGSRQDGRTRAANVIDVGYNRDSILTAILQANDPAFRDSLRGLTNPYGDGHATTRIVDKLKSVALDKTLIVKTFHDIR